MLGVVREVFLIERLGERNAQLLELPIMLLVVFMVARSIVSGAPHLDRASRAAIGALALALMLLAELGVVLFVRGEAIADYLLGRDLLAGGAYPLSLLLFAAAPELVGGPRGGRASAH